MEVPANLSTVQLAVVSVFVMILIIVFRFLMAKYGKDVSTRWITVIIGVVSVGLAYMWLRPTLPQLPSEPTELLNTLGVIASAIIGFATVIYNLIGKQVTEQIGADPANNMKIKPPPPPSLDGPTMGEG